MKSVEISNLIKSNFGKNFDCHLPVYDLPLLCGVLDSGFVEYVEYFFTRLKSVKTSEELNNLFDKYYKHYLELDSDFVKDDLSETNLINMLKLNAIAMILDNSLEYSNLQEYCIESAKEIYGEDKYLEEISKADKVNLSIDTQRLKKNEEGQDFAECINLYIALKQWNDKLHYLLVGNIY